VGREGCTYTPWCWGLDDETGNILQSEEEDEDEDEEHLWNDLDKQKPEAL
jgi:hypothetical protein